MIKFIIQYTNIFILYTSINLQEKSLTQLHFTNKITNYSQKFITVQNSSQFSAQQKTQLHSVIFYHTGGKCVVCTGSKKNSP